MTIPDLSALDQATRDAMRAKVTEALWRKGKLRWKLDETQVAIMGSLESATTRKFLLLCSRRLGKSFCLVLLALERCLQKPGSRVYYAAPSAKDASEIATDIMATILADCPEDLKPHYDAQSKIVKFANGSLIRFRGVNGEKAENIRGGASDLVIGDEIGTWDDALYVVRSILMPLTLTTSGRVLLATTPPRTPGHDSATIYEELAQDNAVVKFTILDNVRISDEIKAEFLKEAGEAKADCMDIVKGLKRPKTTTARREYFCEFVTDASMAVLPEFQAHKDAVVQDSPRPPYFHAYTVIDPGMRDKTGILYAHVDWRRGKVVVEDESLLTGPSTLAIAEELGTKEYALWSDRHEIQRFSDIDLRLMADLWQRHQIRVAPVTKQDSLGAINLVRNMIQTGQLEVHPRCKNLIRQMENAIWNNKATDFDRGSEKGPDGHYDLVAALKYLCRHANLRKNPYPEGYRFGAGLTQNHFRSPRGHKNKDGLGLLSNTPMSKRILSHKKGK